MPFRNSFEAPRYDDAPHLSDQLLLPNLAKGRSIYLFSAFAPSYIFRLLADLAASPEVELGFLNIVFFVPGDLTLKSAGIARFRNYLVKFARDEVEVANFVNNALQLIDEGQSSEVGGLRISILHTSQKRALAKGCIGIISSPESPDDYVAFSDEKGGDYNSPVKPLRSWEDSEFFDAEDILQKVVEASSGSHPRGVFVSDAEAMDWLTYLSNYYLENPPVLVEVQAGNLRPSDDSADDEEGEGLEASSDSDVPALLSDSDSDVEGEEDDFLDYLLDLEEFQDEEQYGWFDDSESVEDLIPIGYFGVVVDAADVVEGHVPPLPISIADMVGPARGECPCGAVIIRAYGCQEVDWNLAV